MTLLDVELVMTKSKLSVQNSNSLDVTHDQYGALLIPLISDKLPEDLKLTLGRNIKDRIWSIHGILNILRIKIEAKERLDSTLNITSKEKLSAPPPSANFNYQEKEE